MYYLPVSDFTQEQNGHPYFTPLFEKAKKQMAVFVKNDCWDTEILLPR